jgi:hypothetical protein
MQCANLRRRNKFDFFFRFRAGTEPIGRLLPAGPQELSTAGSAPLLTPSHQVGGPATPKRTCLWQIRGGRRLARRVIGTNQGAVDQARTDHRPRSGARAAGVRTENLGTPAYPLAQLVWKPQRPLDRTRARCPLAKGANRGRPLRLQRPLARFRRGGPPRVLPSALTASCSDGVGIIDLT